MNFGISIRALVAALGFSLAAEASFAATTATLSAKETQNPYTLIEAAGYGVENPDCGHPVRHIDVAWDGDLKEEVFVFNIHRDQDDDRCINHDRQRLEIKTWGKSPLTMQGNLGDTHTYRWKFRLDADFQPSTAFCHIHQIKAFGGSDAGAPIITITPRGGKNEQMQVIHTPSRRSAQRGGTIAQTALAPFKGEWIEASETTQYTDEGSYALTLTRVRDGKVLLSVKKDGIDMWRAGATCSRPKFGIYRSLRQKDSLRDESVRFADFNLGEQTATSATLMALPAAERADAAKAQGKPATDEAPPENEQ